MEKPKTTSHHHEVKEHADDKPQDGNSKTSTVAIIAIVAIIIIILAGSIFLVRYLQNNNANTATKIQYNHYVFNKEQDGAWYVQLSIKNTPYNIPFYYNPYQTENVSIDNSTMQQMARFINNNPGGDIYVSLDPDSSSKVVISAVELARILGPKYNIFNMNIKSAFSQQSRLANVTINNTAYPIITCDNATSTQMVLMITSGADQDQVRTFNNCVVVEGMDDNETIKVADALVFRILTITG